MENVTPSVEQKDFLIFRNSGKRVYYLKRRAHQQTSETTFAVGPGQTVQAIDEDEEKMLNRMAEFIDIKKETPQIATAIDKLSKELAEARAENARLKAASTETKAAEVPAIEAPAEEPAKQDAPAPEEVKPRKYKPRKK